MLPRVEYVEWIVGRPERATHDLATSDLRDGPPDPTTVVPDRLAGLEDPEPTVGLDAQVAAAHGVEESRVVTTAGATHAYWLALAAALPVGENGEGRGEGEDGEGRDGGEDSDGSDYSEGGERDRVLVERPGYEPLYRTPQAHGATVHRFERLSTDDYGLSPARIGRAVDADTALVVATNRHNPSGRLLDRESLAAAAGAATDAGATLLVDEVYADYTTTPKDGAFGGPTAAGLDGVVATGSLTKLHGLGGLRIGWVIAEEAFVERVERAGAYLPVRATPSVALARRALANRDGIESVARERIRANHGLLADFVDGREDLTGRVFEGASFAFVRHDAADGDAVVDAAWDRNLLVVPGRFFDDPDRFRVSLGGDPDEMADALDVLGETLDDLRRR